MFRVTMLPARHGDSLWVEYGRRKVRRVLIDGGPEAAYPAIHDRVLALPAGRRRLELVVVTHVDADHVGGVLRLLQDRELGLEIGDVWFNGWRHLRRAPVKADLLGPVQGEMLSAAIRGGRRRWNRAFGGKAVVSTPKGPPPVVELKGGLRVVVLSPTAAGLTRFLPEWEKKVREAGLEPGSAADARAELARRRPKDLLAGAQKPNVVALANREFTEDKSLPNGSSIAFLLEYDGVRVVCAGDAHPGVLLDGLQRYWKHQGGKGEVAALKVSHHGSGGSTSPELLKSLQAKKYLISTDGKYYCHPDPEGVARIVRLGRADKGVELYFNYASEFTKPWADPKLCAAHKYQAVYPASGESGLTVEL